MIKTIKEYLEYRKNMRIIKRELIKITAAALPLVREIADKNSRIIKIFTYIADLSPEDIQKILVHSMVETMPDSDEENE